MKKLLILFVALDLIFLGIVMTRTKENTRSIAAVNENDFSELTQGQQNKWHLIETFKFTQKENVVALLTTKLQMICEDSLSIELDFAAQNFAIAGAKPIISQLFSCAEIKNDQALSSLETPLAEFKKMHHQNILKLPTSQLSAFDIYSTEDFPENWRLTEIKIRGPNTFTINEFEIEKVLHQSLDFKIITSAK